MTPSIEARDFPVSAKLRRSGDGSPDPPNRQANLDTCPTCKHSQPLDPLFFGETVYCCLKKHYRYATTCDLYEPADQ
jgi:hypothetical protein